MLEKDSLKSEGVDGLELKSGTYEWLPTREPKTGASLVYPTLRQEFCQAYIWKSSSYVRGLVMFRVRYFRCTVI